MKVNRIYLICDACSLVFLEPKLRLSSEREKARYETHENNMNHSGYIDFLSQVIDPLSKQVQIHSRGLDYGSGPSPVLAQILKSKQYSMDIFDPFFAPEPPLGPYDFVTCTEVLEHVFDLDQVFINILNLLKAGGVLAIMTELLTRHIDFSSWRYRNDDTHICFFQLETIKFIEQRFSLNCIFNDKKRVILFKK